MDAESDDVTAAPTPLERRVALALLILRVTLGLFLLLWGLEKLIIPARTVGIYDHFYGIPMTTAVAPVLGVLQVALALALLAGLWRRWSYGLATLIHAFSVIASWRPLIDPWGLIGGEVKHLFLAGVPVLAGFVVLYMLRDLDLWTIDGQRTRRGEGSPD